MPARQVWKKCTFCNSGRKMCFACSGSGKVSPGWQKCYDCNGFGSVLCTNCGGSGGWRESTWIEEE
ncbi:MAG TPA: hypothetical protein VFA15_00360 [Nitrososphaera sp.]|jgi:hypothetical protein|nr:hypothetical protein [uncultured Nitrososphaera sp.]HZT34341.1 hypothetical protein [Nitrososphaera sp.]